MKDDWIRYDHLNDTYITRDNTIVAAEIVHSACCLLDVFNIALIRQKQRESKGSIDLFFDPNLTFTDKE